MPACGKSWGSGMKMREVREAQGGWQGGKRRREVFAVGSQTVTTKGVIRLGDHWCFRYKCDPIRLVITDDIAAAQPAAC